MKLHAKPTKVPNSSQAIFNHSGPSNGKARKTNSNPKIVIEKSPERCHVKARFKSDPFINFRTSDGGSKLRGFSTAIRPKDNNCAVASAKNG